MSLELQREVREHAPGPGDITPAEFVILLEIADRAQPRDRVEAGRVIRARECFPAREDIARACRLSGAAFDRALQRLAKRGLEVRVPHGMNKDGKPYFARAGMRSVYRLPVLAGRSDLSPTSSECDMHGVTAGRTTVRAEVGPESAPGQTTVRAEVGPESDPKQNGTRTEPEREPSAPTERSARSGFAHGAIEPGSPLSAMGSRTTPEVLEVDFAESVRRHCPDATDLEINEHRSLEKSHSPYNISNMIRARRRNAA